MSFSDVASASSAISSLPPPQHQRIRVGILCVRTRRTIGISSYSPGLEHDAKLYERAFTQLNHSISDPHHPSSSPSSNRFDVVRISPEWNRDGTAKAQTIRLLSDPTLDVLIGFEEFGSEDMIEAILNSKKSAAAASPSSHSLPVVVWIPNCEVLDDCLKNSRWRATLSALPRGLIDLVVSKMPVLSDFTRCIRNVYEACHTELKEENVVHVPHTCLLATEKPTANATDAVATAASLERSSPKSLLTASTASSSATTSSSPSSTTTVPSVTPPPSSHLPHLSSFYIPSSRLSILHFAGSSPHKNTLENCLAGIEIVKRLNKELDEKEEKEEAAASTAASTASFTSTPSLTQPSSPRFHFTCFLCSWPSTKRNNGVPIFAVGSDVLEILRQLALKHSDIFTLLATGFMSYSDRTSLLTSTRLALCASRCEGFGHYILEAAAAGCIVVTTDAPPMRSILEVEKTFALAEPLKEERQCFGYGYSVTPESIVTAAFTLPLTEARGYSPAVIEACTRNEMVRKQRFEESVKGLMARLVEVVEMRRSNIRTTTIPQHISIEAISTAVSSSSSSASSIKLGVFNPSQLVSLTSTSPLSSPSLTPSLTPTLTPSMSHPPGFAPMHHIISSRSSVSRGPPGLSPLPSAKQQPSIANPQTSPFATTSSPPIPTDGTIFMEIAAAFAANASPSTIASTALTHSPLDSSSSPFQMPSTSPLSSLGFVVSADSRSPHQHHTLERQKIMAAVVAATSTSSPIDVDSSDSPLTIHASFSSMSDLPFITSTNATRTTPRGESKRKRSLSPQATIESTC